MKVNLGCPEYCVDYLCVDLNPKDKRVIKANVFDWLADEYWEDDCVVEIYSKNLLEHLPDPGAFLSLCHGALEKGGRLVLITDNAEFLPFYLPFYLVKTGIGAHAKDEYAMSKHCNETHHYSIFTKMHLRNLFDYAGFDNIQVKRILYGVRLKATGTVR
jgi:2-polyprenyl-3-methyl-5-hydroxy-6-metoxy-1,4-benzoquinol methylase